MLENKIQIDSTTIQPTDTPYYYHTDHINTPRVMTSSSGNAAWKASYNAFGYAEVDPSSTITNNPRFPGQYHDSETNLHYNWNRYYDPRTGRYLTPDPIGLEGGIDPYVYTENDPVNQFDTGGQQKDRPKKYQNLNKPHITPTPDPNEALPSKTSPVRCEPCPNSKKMEIYWACIGDDTIENAGTYATASLLFLVRSPLAVATGGGIMLGQAISTVNRCRRMAVQCSFQR